MNIVQESKGCSMIHGGSRKGAGRKPNSGQYKEPTVAKRIPVSLVTYLDEYLEKKKQKNISISNIDFSDFMQQEDVYIPWKGRKTFIPVFASRIPAGFPSPADDHVESRLDLNDYLINNPASTFFLRVSGDSMINAGIHSDDMLVVDRSIEAKNNHIVIAALNGELTVKRLRYEGKTVFLIPENDHYPPIEVLPDMEFSIFGVVTSVIHSVLR